jgi:hypothetical protein
MELEQLKWYRDIIDKIKEFQEKHGKSTVQEEDCEFVIVPKKVEISFP